MNITILGATGATGRELTRIALERGHSVTALARTPDHIGHANHGQITRIPVDVNDPETVTQAIDPATTVLSGLGVSKSGNPDTLLIGAQAVIAAGPERIIWLGAYGTGPSASAAGWPTRTLLRAIIRTEIGAKVAADTAILDAGGTLFHAGPLSDGLESPARRTVRLADSPRRFLPASVSRATVAAAMLDEAEAILFPAATVIPLER